MAKIYRIIEIKLNQFVYLRRCPYDHKACKHISDEHFSEVVPRPTIWRQKSTAIDVEQNCVTVTLCKPTKWRSYRDHRFGDVSSPRVLQAAAMCPRGGAVYTALFTSD